MDWFWTGLGVAFALLAAREIFETLFHPSGRGRLGALLLRSMWRLVHRVAGRRRGALAYGGPLGTLAAIGMWVSLLTLGGAFVYFPRLDDFAGTVPAAGFADAVYLSLQSLTTLGFGDLTPVTSWLRLVVVVEALLGFALLTAAIAWVLSLYGALNRQRALAGRIQAVHNAEHEYGLDPLAQEPAALAGLLGSWTSEIAGVRADLVQYPATYYFHSEDEHVDALPRFLPYAGQLAGRACAADRPLEVRLAAAGLLDALRRLAGTLRVSFLGGDERDAADILREYARDHLVEPASVRS